MASPVQSTTALLLAWGDTIKKHYVPGIFDKIARHGKTTRMLDIKERALDGIKIEYEIARFPNRGSAPSFDLMSGAPPHAPGSFDRFVLHFDHTDPANNDFMKLEVGLGTTYWDLKKKADSNFKGGSDFIARDVAQAVDEVKEAMSRSFHLPTTGLVGTVATSGKKNDDTFVFSTAGTYTAGSSTAFLKLDATNMALLPEGQIIDIYTSGGTEAVMKCRVSRCDPIDFTIHVEILTASYGGGTVVSTSNGSNVTHFDNVLAGSKIYHMNGRDAAPKGNLSQLFNPSPNATTGAYFRDQNGAPIDRRSKLHKQLYPHRISNSGSAAQLVEASWRAAGQTLAFRQGDGNAKLSRMVVMAQDGFNNMISMVPGRPAGGATQATANVVNRFIPALESQIGGELMAAFGFDGYVYHDVNLGAVMAIVDDFAQYGYIRILDKNDWEITVPSSGGFDFLPADNGGIWHNTPGLDVGDVTGGPSLRYKARGIMAYAYVCTAPTNQCEIFNILTTQT